MLTEKQEILYEAIKKYVEENGYSPNFRELGELTNRKSTATVSSELKILKRKGYIDYNPRQNRTIRVLK